MSWSCTRWRRQVPVRLETARAFPLDDPDTIASQVRHVQRSVGPLDDLVQVSGILTFRVGSFLVFVGEIESQSWGIRLGNKGVRGWVRWEEDGGSTDVLLVSCESWSGTPVTYIRRDNARAIFHHMDWSLKLCYIINLEIRTVSRTTACLPLWSHCDLSILHLETIGFSRISFGNTVNDPGSRVCGQRLNG